MKSDRAVKQGNYIESVASEAASQPRLLWIELTSKCGFDCIFCSRRMLRGSGQHMDFALFKSIIGQLQQPEMIRLNYAGESIYYPYLIDAIELAAATGAATELVSAFATIKPSLIEPLVQSGLERLTISLHTTDPGQFQEIYGFGSFTGLTERLNQFLRTRDQLARSIPAVDLAFVAMRKNLGQLMEVADFAANHAIDRISIHPVIRRDPIPVRFDQELKDGRLQPGFQNELVQTVQAVRSRFPGIQLDLASTEIGASADLGQTPCPYPGPLPAGGRIHTCEQNPWETVHILAGGEVVVCEVQDQTPMGDLNRESLAEIWHGSRYRQFRDQYVCGEASKCGSCIYKQAYLPSPLAQSIQAWEGMNFQLSWGWHPPDTADVLWSKRESRLVLSRNSDDKYLKVSGILPAANDGSANFLTINCNKQTLGQVENDGTSPVPFQSSFELDPRSGELLEIQFTVRQAFRPSRIGAGADQRELGFALDRVQATRGQTPSPATWLHRLRYLPLWLVLNLGEHLSKLLLPRQEIPLRWDPGLTVIIPERGDPEMLRTCLQSVYWAAGKLNEAFEIVVVINGCDRADYDFLREAYPHLLIIHSDAPLSFSKAIEKGLQTSHFDAVYLLNSDMVLDKDALHEAGRWRNPSVSAVASQILDPEPDRRREETGWTQLQIKGHQLELLDLFPEDDSMVRGHLYAGGGGSLFNRRLLNKILDRSDPYSPFYWEDAEWGLRSWQMGYEVLFCPASKVFHRRRATVNRYYAQNEIQRIFKRNAVQFELRNRLTKARPIEVVRTVLKLDSQSKKELKAIPNCTRLLRTSVNRARMPHRTVSPDLFGRKYYPRPGTSDPSKPCIVIVSPYAIYPPRHGGAVRMQRLIRELAREFRVVIVSDEMDRYGATATIDKTISALHLVGGRQDLPEEGGSRIDRIRNHSHPLLIRELERVLTVYEPDLVQIEHIELAGLIASKPKRPCIWSLMLHDVYLNESSNSQEDLYERSLLSQFDKLFVVSPEDAELLNGFDVTVVPNGIDLDSTGHVSSQGSSRILFMGPFRYRPNLEGIRLFLERVYPGLRRNVPEVELVLLGGTGAMKHLLDLDPYLLERVTVLDTVPETRPWLERSAVTINPQYNIRGSSIKLLESVAAGRICVSTLEGARGLSGLQLRSLLTVQTIEEFGPVLERLLKDEAYRISLEEPPVEQLQVLTWESSGQKLRETYTSILAGKS